MATTPHEMLAILDDALAATHGKRGRFIALEMHTATGEILGQRGKRLDRPGERPTYGFTRTQCQTIRKIIVDHARADASAQGAEVDSGYTGDYQ